MVMVMMTITIMDMLMVMSPLISMSMIGVIIAGIIGSAGGGKTTTTRPT